MAVFSATSRLRGGGSVRTTPGRRLSGTTRARNLLAPPSSRTLTSSLSPATAPIGTASKPPSSIATGRLLPVRGLLMVANPPLGIVPGGSATYATLASDVTAIERDTPVLVAATLCTGFDTTAAGGGGDGAGGFGPTRLGRSSRQARTSVSAPRATRTLLLTVRHPRPRTPPSRMDAPSLAPRATLAAPRPAHAQGRPRRRPRRRSAPSAQPSPS